MSIIRVEDVNSSLDKLKEEGCIDPAYIENCKNWVYTKSIMWPDQMVSITRPATLITNDIQDNFYLAAQNIPQIDVLSVDGINVYDILKRDKLIITKAALEKIEGRFNERS